jgi:dTDP-4-amino-4,6-dideoxygalactose transaminase
MTQRKFAVWPVFDQDERAAVDSALATGRVNYWTGDEGKRFEAEYAAYLGRRHAIALMNGTVALELPLKMWGIGTDDEVVVTPRSFMASTSCVVAQGAVPVFADVDLHSGNITADTIERVLTPRTRAIIPVHLGGWPCDMPAIMELARTRGLLVLEDCAQAHGAGIAGKPVGSFGDAAAFSFCQDKIITTGGEGGLFSTDDPDLWSRSWAYKDHGKSHEAVFHREHPPGFRWLHESFGTNWRMTELQAAIGRCQLRKLPDWCERRNANASALIAELRNAPGLHVPLPSADVRHAYYRVYAYLELGRLRAGWSRERIMAALAEQAIPCFVGSCSEIYRERAFAAMPWAPRERLRNARELSETSLAFVVHPTLSADDLSYVGSRVREVMRSAVA